MTDNIIKLNKSDVLRLKIQTDDGKETGEYLEFDLEDIELPLKYQELIDQDKKNRQNLKNQLLIIDKREDISVKNKLLTRNEEDKIKALNDFFHKETDVYNLFLGKNGVQKLLNGRKMGWTTLQEIDEIIEKQIVPYIDISMDKITKKIKEKYSKTTKKNNDQVEVIE